MNQSSHTQYDSYLIDQIKPSTPKSVVDWISQNIEMAAKARKRIDDEGIVVRDVKGSVVSHPAIKIEADCQKIICDLVEKYKKRS